jgi:monoamine oxidase
MMSIAIIGTGLAGLSCAYTLLQAGCTNIKVFEAKKRLGGRVHTVYIEGKNCEQHIVEMGGQNITDGGDAQSIITLAKELGLLIEEKPAKINARVALGETDYNTVLALHDKQLSELSFLAKSVNNIGDLIDAFCATNKSLKLALHSRMQAYEGVSTYKQSIYHNIETLECMLSGGIAKAHEQNSTADNDIIMKSIKGGNAELIMRLAERLNHKIELGNALKSVTQNNKKIMLLFENGKGYEVDILVLAIPASTYENIDFTNSGFDFNKLCKIKSIQYGTNYKIALTPKDDIRPLEYAIYKDFISFNNFEKTVRLLYVNNSASNPRNILNEAGIANHKLTHAEDELFKTYNQTIYYDWFTDIYQKGSYSGYSTDISEELDEHSEIDGTAYKSIFSPLNNQVFFAGEHTTILPYIGTMEAAAESGIRIASAIKKIYKDNF